MKSKYRKLTLFLLITFFLPLICIWAQSMIKNNSISFIIYGIEAASPTIAALTILCLNKECKEFFEKKFQTKYLLTSIVLPLVIACATMVFAKLIFCVLFNIEFVLGSISSVQIVIIAWAFFAEEIGWRGYLEPLLKKTFIHVSMIPCVIGIIWCLWHYHYFLQNGVQVPILLFLISCIVESYIYSFLLSITHDNIISAMMYHFSWNLSIHLFAVNPIDNSGNIFPYATLVILELFVVLVFCISKKSKLTKLSLSISEFTTRIR